MSANDKKIDKSELLYYFDSKRKDSKDSHSVCMKSRKVLALRDRLLSLSDEDFETTMQTVNGLLDNRSKDERNNSENNSEHHEAASQLYETAKGADAGAAVGKIDSI